MNRTMNAYIYIPPCTCIYTYVYILRITWMFKNWKNIENDRVFFRCSMYLTIRSTNHYSQIFIFLSEFQSCLDYNNGKDIRIYTRYFSSHLSIVFNFYLIFLCPTVVEYSYYISGLLLATCQVNTYMDNPLLSQQYRVVFFLINKISCMIYFNSDICTSS